MANVVFKRGSLQNFQNNLGRDAQTSRWKQFADGTIYITTDEGGNGGALYMDYLDPDTSKTDVQREQRIRIGDTVQISSNWDDFQAANKAHDAIYYIVSGNILCAWDPKGGPNKTGAWQQINAQKLWNDYFDAFTTATQIGTGQVIVNQSLFKDNQSLLSTALAVKDSSSTKVTATAGDANSHTPPSISIHSEVDTASFAPTANANGITLGIKTTGKINGAVNGDSRLGGQITITPATDEHGNILSGTRINTLQPITEDSADYTIESAQTEYIQYQTNAARTEGTIQSKWVSAATQSSPPGAAEVLMNGAPIKPSIKYGDNLNQNAILNWSQSVDESTDVRTVNLEFDLAVYSKSEIDSKLKAVNAMVFMGGIGEREEGDTSPIILPTTGVHVGDTYAVTKGFSITKDNNTEDYLPGDLIIATGTEGPDGTITSDIDWEHVQSGMDMNATYQYAANINQRKIMLQLNSVTSGTLEFDPNFRLNQTGDGTERVVTIYHATPQDDGQSNKSADTTAWSTYGTTTQTVDLSAATVGNTHALGTAQVTNRELNDSGIIYDSTNGRMILTQKVVTGVKVNSTGHIIGFETTTLKITDTRSGITGITANEYIAQNNHKAAFTTQVDLSIGGNISYRHYLESDSLQFSNTNTTEDASIRVELVWGSF